jgi:hypothetical protein
MKWVTILVVVVVALSVGCSDNPADSSSSNGNVCVYHGSIPGLITDTWIIIDTVDTYSHDNSLMRMAVSYPTKSFVRYIFDVSVTGDQWRIESVDYPLNYFHEISGEGTISNEVLDGTITINDFTCPNDSVELQYPFSADRYCWSDDFFPSWITEPFRFRSDSIILNAITSDGSDIIGVGNFILRSEGSGAWVKSREVHKTGQNNRQYKHVTWTSEEYIITGYSSTGKSNQVLRSVDGILWSNMYCGSICSFGEIGHNGETYVTHGYTIREGAIYPERWILSSHDLTHWSSHRLPPFHLSLGPAIWTGSQFMFLTQPATYPVYSCIYISDDGVSWDSYEIPLIGSAGLDLERVMLWDGQRLLGFSGQKILSSVNGIDWEEIGTLTQLQPLNIAYSGTIYVVGGLNPDSLDFEIWSSENALTWTFRYTSDNTFTDIKWCQNRFLAVSRNVVLSSSDGVNWHEESVQ